MTTFYRIDKYRMLRGPLMVKDCTALSTIKNLSKPIWWPSSCVNNISNVPRKGYTSSSKKVRKSPQKFLTRAGRQTPYRKWENGQLNCQEQIIRDFFQKISIFMNNSQASGKLVQCLFHKISWGTVLPSMSTFLTCKQCESVSYFY